MGNSPSNQIDLGSADLQICQKLSGENHISSDTVQKALKEWRAKKISDTKGISTPAQLDSLLEAFGYYDTLVESIVPAIKAALPPNSLLADDSPSLAKESAWEAFRNLSKLPAFRKLHSKMLFHGFDSDHNGSVSFREFVVGMTAMQNDRTSAEVRFDAWDEDGNAYLTRDEVKEMWRNEAQGSMVTNRIFKASMYALTMAHSGGVNFEEAKYIFKTIFKKAVVVIEKLQKEGFAKLETQEDEVDFIFQLADTNHDNRISREEFIQYATDPKTVAKIQARTFEFDRKVCPAAEAGARLAAKVPEWVKEMEPERKRLREEK